MKFFVTGGTGFIGSHFILKAIGAGHEVTATRRSGAKSPDLDGRGLRWLETGLEGIAPEDLKNHDALLHFAAQGVSPQPTDWSTAFEVNVLQSIRLFQNAQAAGIPHLIACGSCFEYGRSGERYDFIPADAPLEPIGPYAASKATFSFALESMARTSPASFTIIRPFHLFGEGQHESNLWPSLRIAALSGIDFPMTTGEQIRDYMPVDQAAIEFLRYATDHPVSGSFKVVNIGSGHPVSLKDFATSWWREWAAVGQLRLGDIPYRKGEIMRFVPKISNL